jgi:hypothetical protein
VREEINIVPPQTGALELLTRFTEALTQLEAEERKPLLSALGDMRTRYIYSASADELIIPEPPK